MKRKYIVLLVPLLLLLNIEIGIAEKVNEVDNQPSVVQKATAVLTGEQINWQVISSGGNRGISTNYSINGTVGQTAVGKGSSSNYSLSNGFWHESGGGTPGCCLLRGDVAVPKDGSVLVNDIVYLVNYIFKGGPAPSCLDEGDCAVPSDGNILVNDIVYLVNYLFKGGPIPPAC